MTTAREGEMVAPGECLLVCLLRFPEERERFGVLRFRRWGLLEESRGLAMVDWSPLFWVAGLMQEIWAEVPPLRLRILRFPRSSILAPGALMESCCAMRCRGRIPEADRCWCRPPSGVPCAVDLEHWGRVRAIRQRRRRGRPTSPRASPQWSWGPSGDLHRGSGDGGRLCRSVTSTAS